LSRLVHTLRDARRALAVLAKQPLMTADPSSRYAVFDLQRSVDLNFDPRYTDARNLLRHGYKVYSQFDEDGIIQRIFDLIGPQSRTFVEIGVGDGLENNTTHLLLLGWRGFWVEASPSHLSSIRQTFAHPLADRQLRLVGAFVSAETVLELLADVPTDFDFLSVDIDGNDYYIWEALARLRPRVVCIEYNACMGPAANWKSEYDPEFRFTHDTMIYGASLKALQCLGNDLGYRLVGCGYAGINAFFVRADLVSDHFQQPFEAEWHYQPLRAHSWRQPPRKYAPAFCRSR
jgi:hypothetical protein